MSQTSLARELGVSQPTVSDWIRGRKTPRTKHVLAIAALTRGGVPLRDWVVPADVGRHEHRDSHVRRLPAAPQE